MRKRVSDPISSLPRDPKSNRSLSRSRPVSPRVPKPLASLEGVGGTQNPKPEPRSGLATSQAAELEQMAARIRVCIECPLHASRTIAVPGEGRLTAKVMIIGEAPGAKEDKTGRPFVGSSGQYLDHVLEGTGFDRADFFITNIVKCRPPSNRTPKTNEIDTCTTLYLFKQIRLLDPKLIMLLGGVAVKRMLGLKTVEEARGRVLEHEGRQYLATYHPAVRFYRQDLADKIKQDFSILKAELQRLDA